MRYFFIILSLCVFIFANTSNTKTKLNDEETKKAIVSCANYHLEFCEKLIANGLPSLRTCNVRTECEFAGWLYAQVQSYTQSLPYLKKACDNRHMEGCNKLGFSYQRLNDYKRAKKYYKIACNNDNMGGCYNLAMLYYDGIGVRHSYEVANTLFQKICDNKEGLGCLQLAISYANGYGVFQNIDTALQYFKTACSLGNNESCSLYDEYSRVNQSKNEDQEDNSHLE